MQKCRSWHVIAQAHNRCNEAIDCVIAISKSIKVIIYSYFVANAAKVTHWWKRYIRMVDWNEMEDTLELRLLNMRLLNDSILNKLWTNKPKHSTHKSRNKCFAIFILHTLYSHLFSHYGAHLSALCLAFSAYLLNWHSVCNLSVNEQTINNKNMA